MVIFSYLKHLLHFFLFNLVNHICRRLETNNLTGTIPNSFCNIFQSLTACGKNSDGLSLNVFTCPFPSDCSMSLVYDCGAVCRNSSTASTVNAHSEGYTSTAPELETPANMSQLFIIVTTSLSICIVVLVIIVIVLATKASNQKNNYRRQTDETIELSKK